MNVIISIPFELRSQMQIQGVKKLSIVNTTYKKGKFLNLLTSITCQ